MKRIATVLILVGLVCYAVAGYHIWIRYTPNKLTFTDYKPRFFVPVNTTHFPVKLTLPDLQIDVPIIPSKITNGIWETTDKGASYLLSSPIPGTVGNSIIYAHDFTNLFGPLVNAKPGEKIIVSYSDGTRIDFVIAGTQIVSPSESSILSESQDKRITLYTCTGWFETMRFVVVATEQSE